MAGVALLAVAAALRMRRFSFPAAGFGEWQPTGDGEQGEMIRFKFGQPDIALRSTGNLRLRGHGSVYYATARHLSLSGVKRWTNWPKWPMPPMWA